MFDFDLLDDVYCDHSLSQNTTQDNLVIRRSKCFHAISQRWFTDRLCRLIDDVCEASTSLFTTLFPRWGYNSVCDDHHRVPGQTCGRTRSRLSLDHVTPRSISPLCSAVKIASKWRQRASHQTISLESYMSTYWWSRPNTSYYCLLNKRLLCTVSTAGPWISTVELPHAAFWTLSSRINHFLLNVLQQGHCRVEPELCQQLSYISITHSMSKQTTSCLYWCWE